MKLKQFNIDPKEILGDTSNERLLTSLSRFADLLEKFDYSVRVFSDSALQKLSEVSIEKKQQIAADFESWAQWIEPLDPRSYDNELTLLKRALDKHGFEADERFLKTLEKDQIIELYNENMIQLYRSFNFFKITGYSLLDISVFEWYILWDRPQKILESIGEEINESLQVYTPIKKFKTGRHLVREVFNTTKSGSFVPRASLLTPVNLGSLKPTRPTKFNKNNKHGFICTSTGELIAIGKETENIHFI